MSSDGADLDVLPTMRLPRNCYDRHAIIRVDDATHKFAPSDWRATDFRFRYGKNSFILESVRLSRTTDVE